MVFLKQILTWLGQSEVRMNRGYPFGERVDDDFAIGGQRKSNAEGLLESNEVLVEVHLVWGVARRSENSKVEGSNVGANKVHLVVSVAVEDARGWTSVGAAQEQRRRVVRARAKLHCKHGWGCGYGGEAWIEGKIGLWLRKQSMWLFENLERIAEEEGTGQGKRMGGARGDCVGHTF